MLLGRGQASEIWVQLTVAFLVWFKAKREIQKIEVVEEPSEENSSVVEVKDSAEVVPTPVINKFNKYDLYCLFCTGRSNLNKSSAVNNGTGFKPFVYELLIHSRYNSTR